jgi:hypothetical protein
VFTHSEPYGFFLAFPADDEFDRDPCHSAHHNMVTQEPQPVRTASASIYPRLRRTLASAFPSNYFASFQFCPTPRSTWIGTRIR